MTTARDLAGRLAPPRPAPVTDVMASQVKYTLLMTSAEADDLDQLILRVRRANGRRLTKSELIRPLLGLLVTDSTLLAQVLDAVLEA